MSHSPPIPAGNTSPYPLQDAPHVHGDAPPTPDLATEGGADEHDAGDYGYLSFAALGALVGVGAAVLAGVAYALTRFDRPDGKKRRRKKR